MLSYFGTDQSQVQRYLAAKSTGEAKSSLLMSAYWKIPLQALVLLVGVGVFVYYQFVRPPPALQPGAGGRGGRRARPRVRRATERLCRGVHASAGAAAQAVADASGDDADRCDGGVRGTGG